MSSVFTKIVNGELPSYKIHEDELTFSFLALDQVNLGHTLVIPKREVNHWFDVPEEDYTRVQLKAQEIAKAIQKATDAPRIATVTLGFEVQHYHLHLIPAWSIAEVQFSRAQRRSVEEMNSIQKKIVSHLKFKATT
jgi:histidine triad (HIT) family protein